MLMLMLMLLMLPIPRKASLQAAGAVDISAGT
jgi:hypothetical protein